MKVKQKLSCFRNFSVDGFASHIYPFEGRRIMSNNFFLLASWCTKFLGSWIAK